MSTHLATTVGRAMLFLSLEYLPAGPITCRHALILSLMWRMTPTWLVSRSLVIVEMLGNLGVAGCARPHPFVHFFLIELPQPTDLVTRHLPFADPLVDSIPSVSSQQFLSWLIGVLRSILRRMRPNEPRQTRLQNISLRVIVNLFVRLFSVFDRL